MRILFISNWFFPEGNAPANRVYALAQRWVKLGHQVTVITCVPNVPTGIPYVGYKNRWRQRETIDGIEVLRVWTLLAPNKGVWKRSLSHVSFLISATLAGLKETRPDIVIATSPHFLAACAGALVTWCRRLPFVLEIRDIWPESIVVVEAKVPSVFIYVLAWLERRLYRMADHVVTVGKGYRQKLMTRGIPEEKLSVISNGVDEARFREAFADPSAQSSLRDQWQLGDRFVCAYIGTIGMACGLAVVLRAARLLRNAGRQDVCFLLVGDGAVYASLKEKVHTENLGEWVIMTGLQPKNLVPAFLSIADACLVHLARKELFKTVMPSKIFEAAAMCKPIILGVEGFAASFLTDAGAGICIEPENEMALIDAVTELSKNPELAKAMGQLGKTYVKSHYNIDDLAKRYLQVLSHLPKGVKVTCLKDKR